MSRWSAVVLTWIVMLAAAPMLGGQEGEYRPPPPPEQPIAFSHRVHAGQGQACTACHAGAATGDRATLPPTTTCMGCHATIRVDSGEILKLAAFHEKKEDVPWRRVVRVPAYVTFSHRAHLAAGSSISCETCHGNVRELTAMQKLKDTSMAACMSCHTEKAAPTQCDACHEPR